MVFYIDCCFVIVLKIWDIIQEYDNVCVFGFKCGDVVVGFKNIMYLVDEYYNVYFLFRFGWFYSVVQQFKQVEYCWKICFWFFKYQEDLFGWGVINILMYLVIFYYEYGFFGEVEVMYWEVIGRLEVRK